MKKLVRHDPRGKDLFALEALSVRRCLGSAALQVIRQVRQRYKMHAANATANQKRGGSSVRCGRPLFPVLMQQF